VDIHLPPDVALSYYKSKVSNPQLAKVEFPPVVSDKDDLPFYDDKTFHAVVVTNGDVFTIDLKELHENDKNSGEILGTDNNHGMVMIRQSDVVGRNSKGDSKIESVAHKSRKLLATTTSSPYNISKVTVFYNCYPGQFEYIRGINIGVITDVTFNAVYGNNQSKIMSAVTSIFADNAANFIYFNQLNIYWTLGTYYIGSSSSSVTPSSLSCSLTINDQLDSFTTWRSNYYKSNPNEKNGVWHLLTNCHPPPGTVGLAWVGVLCSYASGTGVSNYINPSTSYYGTGTWETMAHEVGHNFGANHAFQEGQGTTGGIMDYGDGKYPPTTGVYEFHPTYNQQEVCTQLTSAVKDSKYRTAYQLLNVSACFYQYSKSPTPAPTTPIPTTGSPTYKPTPKPTQKPVAPGPTLKPTYSPTNRPTTASPTFRPTTPSPTASSNTSGTYIWEETGDYTSCWPDCGSNSFRTAVIGCYQQVVYMVYWYYLQQVDDSYCDINTKPVGSQQACQLGVDIPTCDPVCGDGFISKGEICDTATSTGSCCNNDCLSFKTNLTCWLVNPVIDAAFQDSSSQTYLFQGPYYARYANYVFGSSSNKPDSGFPKTIYGSFPITVWTRDISAIAYKSDNEIWVFKGLLYTKIDMHSGQLAGYPKSFTADYNVPNDIITCGTIDGAIALYCINCIL